MKGSHVAISVALLLVAGIVFLIGRNPHNVDHPVNRESLVGKWVLSANSRRRLGVDTTGKALSLELREDGRATEREFPIVNLAGFRFPSVEYKSREGRWSLGGGSVATTMVTVNLGSSDHSFYVEEDLHQYYLLQILSDPDGSDGLRFEKK